MVKTLNQLDGHFANVLYEKIERKVERRFEGLVSEGKEEKQLLKCLETIKEQMKSAALIGKTADESCKKEKATHWLQSKHCGVLIAGYLGIRKSTWMGYIGQLLGNVE